MVETSHALQRIARGAEMIFIGTVISMLLGFLSVTVIARVFSRAEYGVFSLALTILSVAGVMAVMRFQNSLPKEIAFYSDSFI